MNTLSLIFVRFYTIFLSGRVKKKKGRERVDRVDNKETVLRKSEYQQKVLKFKKTSTFSQNLIIDIVSLIQSVRVD